MAAGLIADVILVFHFLWILFAIFGALAIFRWPRLIWVHPVVLAWSVLVMLTGWLCPLTPAELYFRELAGQRGFDGGFIEHYVTAAVYPSGLTRGVQIGLGVALAAFNVLAYVVLFKYRRQD